MTDTPKTPDDQGVITLDDHKSATEAQNAAARLQLAAQREQAIEQIQRQTAWLNRNYFAIMLAGKFRIGRMNTSSELGASLEFITVRDFRDCFRGMKAPSPDDPTKSFNVAKAWLESDDVMRNCYDAVGVYPPGTHCPKRRYNMWQGFGVRADKRGSCETILYHLREVVCSGNAEHYDYLIKWMARAIQFPGMRGDIAVCINGSKGTGKTIAATLMRKIFKHHGLVVTNKKHVLGAFNDHMQHCLFLHLEEVDLGGNGNADGTIKTLVTDDVLFIEPKGLAKYQVANKLTILATSNAEMPFSVTKDERRFFNLRISDARIGDSKYFKRLHSAVQNDEIGSFLHFLRNVNLDDFDHRKPPKTDELREQINLGLDPFFQFVRDTIITGSVPGDDGDMGIECDPETGFPEAIPKHVFQTLYEDYASARGQKSTKSDSLVSRELRKLIPSIKLARPRTDAGRVCVFKFPDRDVMHAEYNASMNDQIQLEV